MGSFVSCRGRGAAVIGAAMLLLAACSGEEPGTDAQRPHFVTTVPPFEMILERLVDGRGRVERLLEPGVSPHTYDPTPSDLRATTAATALVYGAEVLDGWAADLPASRRLELGAMVPAGARLSFEGGHGHGAVDPHFWTDPLAVKQLVPVLADTLCAVDPPGCSTSAHDRGPRHSDPAIAVRSGRAGGLGGGPGAGRPAGSSRGSRGTPHV